jgi:hypothetical protein
MNINRNIYIYIYIFYLRNCRSGDSMKLPWLIGLRQSESVHLQIYTAVIH